MDCSFGVSGKDFVIVASDCSSIRSIIKFKDDEEKITKLNNNQVLACSGETADRKSFSQLVKCELDYYLYRYNNQLNAEETANYIRTILAENLRKSPYQANCLLAGFDKDEGASLYWFDYMGSMQRTNNAAHGYGSHFILSVMDAYLCNNFDKNLGKTCIKQCINELKKRFLVALNNFDVILIDENGVQNISEEIRAL
jgi:20S proteasome subunit beta 4